MARPDLHHRLCLRQPGLRPDRRVEKDRFEDELGLYRLQSWMFRQVDVVLEELEGGSSSSEAHRVEVTEGRPFP